MKRLILINPMAPRRVSLSAYRIFRFPPLNLGIIAAVTPKSWDVTLIDENWQKFEYLEADLVGITALTTSANRAYEIAKTYKRQGSPVVMGGIHASFCHQEALRFVDSVVIGEAENIWPQVLTDAEGGKLKKVYRGKRPDLAGLPITRRDLFDKRYLLASVQTSRGCPLGCEFCSVPVYNGIKYRRRPVDEILRELKTIPQKLLFFIDDNIIGYGTEARNEAIELFRAMVKERLNKWWFCQASINFADDEELLLWAKRAGCKMVFLGLEAENTDTLAEINKWLNLNRGVDGYPRIFKRIHSAGIAVLGAFMYGAVNDNLDTYPARSNYILNSEIDAVQADYMTPLPGTSFFNKIRDGGRLLYTDFPKDWERYDGSEAVTRLDAIPPDTMIEASYKYSRILYSWPVLIRKVVQSLFWTKSPIAAAFAFCANLNYRKVALTQTALFMHKKGTAPPLANSQ